MDFFRSATMRRILYGLMILLALGRFVGRPRSDEAPSGPLPSPAAAAARLG
jgi:hypothetical protein